jgi:hypothetical protein
MYKSMMTVAAAMLVSSVAMAQTSTPASPSQNPGPTTPPAASQQNCQQIADEAQRTACLNNAQTGSGSGSMSTGSPPSSTTGSGSGSLGSGSSSGSGSMDRSPTGSGSGTGGSSSGSGTTR